MMNEDRRQQELLEELQEYEQKYPMDRAEKRALHRWVESGHSVYEAAPSRYICDCALPIQDFLDVYRQDIEISRELKGKTRAEKEAWLREYMGYAEPVPEKKATEEEYRNHIRKLERELFHLWDYVGQEGLWSEAKEYVEERKEMEIPFEFTL